MHYQRIFQNLEIFINGRSCYLSVVCYIREVYNRAIAERSYPEETAEGRDVTGCSFSNNLLLKIHAGICMEICTGIVRKID